MEVKQSVEDNKTEERGIKMAIVLENNEKIRALREIRSRLKKILYVYDKQQEDDAYNYKTYTENTTIFVSSSNILFDGELVNILVNLNAILTNDFGKQQIKRLVFESKNQVEYLIDKYEHPEEYEEA